MGEALSARPNPDDIRKWSGEIKSQQILMVASYLDATEAQRGMAPACPHVVTSCLGPADGLIMLPFQGCIHLHIGSV